ncbi:MAG: hypothetical protein NXI04_07465 [Planctomycetaceae bacterium]|nr:hypothetical protein [Planctomycetaceae bacterium]
MPKTVLSVGQCRPDNAALSHFLKSNFDVEVLTSDLPDDTQATISGQQIDLVLINRKLDADYSDGMEILKSMKASEATAAIPVMLVSNFPEWQEKAVAEGAVYGFGKSELTSAETVDRVRSALKLT